jgi:hypothetical protein
MAGGNNGLLTSIATSTFYAPGKIGQAFRFDGVDDYVDLGNSAWISQSFSVSAWVKTDYKGASQVILSKLAGASSWQFYFRLAANGQVVFKLYGVDSTVDQREWGTTQTGFNDGKWHHVVATAQNIDGNIVKTITMYVDGTAWPNTLINSFGTNNAYTVKSSTIKAGAYFTPSLGLPFNGSIDDPRVYNRVLSATEVKQLYNLGAEGHLSAAPPVIATSSCSTGLSCGLVGYWTFDGKDTPNGTVRDKSGNGNNGTLSGIATSTFYIQGKMGQAFNFDGVNDSVTVASSASLPTTEGLSYSMWIKSNSTGGTTFFARPNSGTGYALSYAFGNRLTFAHDGSTDMTARTSSSFGALPIGVWTHVVVTWDGSTTAANVLFYKNTVVQAHDINTNGVSLTSTSGQNFIIGGSGGIDDVRLYNRVLSVAEIKQLYILGNESHQASSPQVTATSTCTTGLSCGLVGYWTFDGKDTSWTSASAGTTLDKSGSGGTGTLTGMSQVATPGFGKYGQALNFRGGVGEYVNVADANRYSFGNGTTDTPFSLSAWIQYDSSLSGSYSQWPVICKWTDIGNAEWCFYINYSDLVGGQTGNGLTLQINKSGGTTDRFIVEGRTPVPRDKWSHVVATYDGSSTSAGMKVYLNGVQETTDLFTAGTYTAMSNLAAHVDIGGLISANNSFDAFAKGKIDDVRMYNRALSAAEILRLYNGGR